MNKLILQLRTQAESMPGAVAFAAPGYPDLDYGALPGSIDRVVDQFVRLGINKGDAVAFIADREPATATLALGLLGHALAIPVNPDARPHELTPLFMRLPIKAVLVPTGYRINVSAPNMGPGIAIIEYEAQGWDINFRIDESPAIRTGNGHDQGAPGDTSLILQTSGTTAMPRLVPLSQDNLLVAAGNVIRSLDLGRDDSCLHMLPMFHIGGLVDVLLAPLLSGGKVVFNHGFDAQNFFRNVTTYAPGWTQTVPAMLQELVEQAGRRGYTPGPDGLRLIRSVSAPLPASLYHAAQRVFSTVVVEIYGMTETAGVITSNPLQAARQKPGSVGVSAGPAIRIVSTEGKSADPLQTGEVQVKGDSVMSGYLAGNPKEDTGLELEGGWLRTGDLGYLDEEGYLFLTGRCKDIINRGGEKVSPAEVDNLVLQFPGVSDAASFAIADPSLGEDIALAVVWAADAPQQADELGAYLKDRLAYYKVPGRIVAVDAIPRSNGKLRRHQLADWFAEAMSDADPGAGTDSAGPGVVRNRLADLWGEVLEIDRIRADDDFFFLGGNSLLATVLVNRIQERWGIPVMVSAIYDAPVFHEFEQHLSDRYPEQTWDSNG